MNSFIRSAVACLLLSGAAGAEPPTTVPAEVAALIAQLSDADSGVRDAAQASLAKAGEDAIPALKAARETNADPDVQLRLEALIVGFQEVESIGASHITLKFESAPLKEVLDEFSRQSKAVFSDPAQDFGNDPPRITIDVQDVSFWQALSALRVAGNLGFLPQQDIWRVTRNFGNPLFGSSAVESGAFLIQPMNASYSRSISYSPNVGSGENFMISFQIMSEPKIRMTQAAGQFRVTKAIDTNGNSLLGPNGLQSFGVGQNVFHVSAQLAYPKQPGEKIEEFSGTMKLNVARSVESMTIDEFTPSSKPVQETIGGVKVTIAPAEANPAQPNWVNLAVVVESSGDPMVFNRMQQAIRQIRVIDSAGRPMQMNMFQPNAVTPQRGDFRVSFMPVGNGPVNGACKVTFDVPTSFREVEIPFTLKDLKMP